MTTPNDATENSDAKLCSAAYDWEANERNASESMREQSRLLRNQESVKAASNAPAYAAMYQEFAEICRKHGYALAIHGSLQRDFDVIAVPWTETPSDPQEVVNELESTFAIDAIRGPNQKPHGRICWSIVIGFGHSQLDFSFIPTSPRFGDVEPNEAALLKRAMCVLQEASEDLAADGHLSEQTIATINAVLLDK